MSDSSQPTIQFNFWTLIIACNLAAVIIGAGYQIEASPNLLSTLVCFAAISCATAGGMLLLIAALFSISILLTGEAHHSNSYGLSKCWDLALLGAGLIGPGLLFTLMMNIRSLAVGF